MRKLLLVPAAALALAGLFLSGAATRPEAARAVSDNDAMYSLCARVFPDPHAFWPSPAQAPTRSPFAKGNAACAASDFVSYGDMISGMEYLESLFPQFVEFYNLEQDFGDGSDCATSTSSQDYCSAGLPRQGVPTPERLRSDFYMIRITDERVSSGGKKYFVFPLSIHGIERAGAEAGVRAAEDLATWGFCQAVQAGQLPPKPMVNCAREGAIPHPILETTPGSSINAGEALKRSAIYFIFPNPDGWRRGDPDNTFRFYQRYGGNGVDLNRDWPTIGYTFEPYTPWSEPDTRGFGKVLKQIKPQWDGGIDLHGQLIDSAFSFTLLGASERNFAKNQRILQTVKGAWEDAEARLAWSPAIKPNDADPDDPRMYGVQWGTVWDTIDYTVTGALGDWIDSPLGLGADGIDNEMSFSHISNCGIGSCYLTDFEQLHVDGNKSLIYAMVNFTLQPEDTTFRVAGKVGYVLDSTVRSNPGQLLVTPKSRKLQPQDPILDVALTPSNNFTYQFEVLPPSKNRYNGGVEAKATPVNVAGVGAGSLTSLVLEQWRPEEETPQEDQGCGEPGDQWGEVNRYFNQSPIYLQSGQAVHANSPTPGMWRVCITGGLADQIASTGGHVDVDITFSKQKAWEDPGQVPYSVTNMKFFTDIAKNMSSGQLTAVKPDSVLSGTANLDGYTSIVVADDPFPGYTEAASGGAAQAGQVHEPPTAAAATVPCAWPTNPVLPPTCVANYEFDVDSTYNNQQLIVRLTAPSTGVNDWDLYVQRQSKLNGSWFTVGQSATGNANET